MNKAKLFSLLLTGVLVLFTFFGVGPSFFPTTFQFYKNLAQNNNRLNYANREYGYNLMKGAELNSIFMTEGGDNQVFSLLYLSSAERRRPDIDFYDQKGNVFPRLYGDLLNTYPDELELIRDIRDYQLYSTGRPIYLTWKRVNLKKLSLPHFQRVKKKILEKSHRSRHRFINSRFKLRNLEELKETARNMVNPSIYDLSLRSGGSLKSQDFRYLGPWYFKRFGLIYRVTPIRYAIVDGLEVLGGKASQSQVLGYVSSKEKINLSKNQWLFYVRELVKEGYLESSASNGSDALGVNLILKKPFRAFEGKASLDYWKDYSFSYRKADNANAWDFLTREVFGNYSRAKSDAYLEAANESIETAQYAKDNATKQLFLNKSSEYKQKAMEAFSESIRYNYDNSFMMYTYGQRLYNSKSSNRFSAPKYLALSSGYDYRFVSGYLDALKMIYNLLPSANEAQSKRLKKEAQVYAAGVYAGKKLLFNSQKNISKFSKDNSVQQAKFLLQKIEATDSFGEDKMEDLKKTAEDNKAKLLSQGIEATTNFEKDKMTDLKKGTEGNEAKFLQLANILNEQKNWAGLAEIYESLINIKPNNFNYRTQLYSAFMKSKNLAKAIDVLSELMQKYDQLDGNKPPLWSLNYNLGWLYLGEGQKNVNNQDRAKGVSQLEAGKKYFELFVKAAEENLAVENNAKLGSWVVNSKKSLGLINELLGKK